MPLRSAILAGNARLEAAANGAPSVKKAPPADDAEAVRRIQKALVTLGFPLPISFPQGPSGEPDGKFGTETFNAVIAFQRHAFPNEPGQWDGRVGKNTLAVMDEALSTDEPTQIGPVRVTTTTKCTITATA
jgi:peptidoglycan hydrolase-like protein with peptidoglycan-binding domain